MSLEKICACSSSMVPMRQRTLSSQISNRTHQSWASSKTHNISIPLLLRNKRLMFLPRHDFRAGRRSWRHYRATLLRHHRATLLRRFYEPLEDIAQNAARDGSQGKWRTLLHERLCEILWSLSCFCGCLLLLCFCETFGLVGGLAFFVVVCWDGIHGEHDGRLSCLVCWVVGVCAWYVRSCGGR